MTIQNLIPLNDKNINKIDLFSKFKNKIKKPAQLLMPVVQAPPPASAQQYQELMMDYYKFCDIKRIIMGPYNFMPMNLTTWITWKKVLKNSTSRDMKIM